MALNVTLKGSIQENKIKNTYNRKFNFDGKLLRSELSMVILIRIGQVKLNKSEYGQLNILSWFVFIFIHTVKVRRVNQKQNLGNEISYLGMKFHFLS